MILHTHRLDSCSPELKEAIKSLADADQFKEFDIIMRNCTSTTASFVFYDVDKNIPITPKNISAEMIEEQTGCEVTTQASREFTTFTITQE